MSPALELLLHSAPFSAETLTLSANVYDLCRYAMKWHEIAPGFENLPDLTMPDGKWECQYLQNYEKHAEMRSVTDIDENSYLHSTFLGLKLCLQWLLMPLDAGWLHLLQLRN